jgi:hypothetical protein
MLSPSGREKIGQWDEGDYIPTSDWSYDMCYDITLGN